MKATLFTWNINGTDAAKLRFVCMRLRVSLRPVSGSEDSRPVGRLKAAAPSDTAPHAFEEPMILLAGFSQLQLSQFFDLLEAQRLPRWTLRAVLTPANAIWDAHRLHDELQEEHRLLRPDTQEDKNE